MFTGLVEDVGVLFATRRKSEVLLLEIGETALAGELRKGDSISVSGACLSVVDILSANRFTAELMPETAERTTLGSLPAGTRVNLERALPVSGRFEGHVVTGHVDVRGTLIEMRRSERTALMRIGTAREYLRYVAPKGSIAVDGVSLTVIEKGSEAFSVGIIPETLRTTTLGQRKATDIVNLECDILAKYLESLAFGGAGPDTGRGGLAWKDLREMGWEF
ncbi:MAG: riboflavin synthase [Thermovirgaceae bacterium]